MSSAEKGGSLKLILSSLDAFERGTEGTGAWGTGRLMSSSLPWMTVTWLERPFSSTICCACSAMLDISTAYTCFAPACVHVHPSQACVCDARILTAETHASGVWKSVER